MAASGFREALLSDAAQIAEVLAAGFIDDDVFGRFMHPKRRKFPGDWVRYWHKEVSSHIVDASCLCHVIIDDDTNKVAAVCVLKRLGDAASARAASDSFGQKGQRLWIFVQNYWDSLTWTDRSADAEAMAAFDKNWEDICHYFKGSRKECYLIDFLCVHPDAQKKGHGRKLIQNAIQVCQSEDPAVPLAVIASEIGDAFYEKQGFREAGRANVGGLSGVKGGSLKFYERHLQR